MSSIINALSSEVPVTSSVRYACAFDNNWSGTNHPVGYPANAHWSPPVIASHSSDFSMWKPGELASEGVVTVAEVRNIIVENFERQDKRNELTAIDAHLFYLPTCFFLERKSDASPHGA